MNFPIRLNNRFASLRRSVETGDAKPTNGAYKVFEELSIELKAHLDSLDKILANSLNILNDQLIGKRLDPISSMINKTIN